MVKPPLITLALIGIIVMPLLKAGEQDAKGIAQSEQTRRQENVPRAKATLAEADKAFKDKHYDVAATEYQAACDLLPEAPLTHSLRAMAIDGFSRASVRLAEQRIAEDRFPEAEGAVKKVLEPKYNPTYKPALLLLPVVSAQQIKKLQLLFAAAQAFYDKGKYDLAYKSYDQILSLDPYNLAARRGQEKVVAARPKYAGEDSDPTPFPRKYVIHDIVRIGGAGDHSDTEYIQNKLNHIIIPRIDFKELTVREAIDFLKKKSVELDTLETDPARKGVNIMLKLESAPPAGETPAGTAISPADAKINLNLSNIPLSEALRYITSLSGLKVKIHPYAVVIVPLSEPEPLITKEYKVPPNIFHKTALQFLEEAGVPFPDGASANFLAASNKLVVRNTEANLDLVDQIVAAMTPKVPDTEYIQNKLNHIIIPKIDFKEITVREAVDFLRKKSVELDTTEVDPARKGINIVFETDVFTPDGQPFPDRNIASTPDAKITFSMTNVPLWEALYAVTSSAGLLRYKVEPCAVVIVPIPGDDFATKEYKVPKGFLAGKDGHVQTARQFLESSGVTFHAGTDAIYIPASSKLVVRNSDENLDLVDQIVEAARPVVPDTEYIRNKLDRIIIPKIEFKETSVREAIDFLKKKSVELDTTETDPARKGVNIVLKLQPILKDVVPDASPSDAKITLSLTNIPLSQALRYVAEIAHLTVKVDPHTVTIVPLSLPEPMLIPVTK